MMPTSAEIMGQLQSFDKTAQTPEAALAEQNTALGVQGAQDKVSGLRTAINNTTTLLKSVAPSIMGRTANSLVTSAQASRQIANESAPIADNLETQNRDYNTANEDYNMTSAKAERLANAKVSGQNTRRSFLQQLYDSLYTGEENSRRAAEDKRQFDIDQANGLTKARISASGSSGGNPTLNALLAGMGGSAGGSVPSFPKGTTPQQAVAQLFQGYQRGTKPGYTENVVIPALTNLARVNYAASGKTSISDENIQQIAKDLAYRYRKSAFGE